MLRRDDFNHVPAFGESFVINRKGGDTAFLDASALLCDNAAIAGAAADLFLRHGLEHFAYVGARTGVAGNSFDLERREGYVGALAAHGFVPAIYEPTQPPKRWWR